MEKQTSKRKSQKVIIAEMRKEIEEYGHSHLEHSGHGIRVDYSKNGYEHRLNGSFGSVENGDVHMPYLRTIWDLSNQRDYILVIEGNKKNIRGQIRKLSKNDRDQGDLLSVKELTQYVQTTSIGLAIMSNAVQVGTKNGYMYQDKEFTSEEKFEILSSAAKTQSALAVLSEMIRRAMIKKAKRIEPKEFPELLRMHRLI